jgi:hypothetical protein
MPLVEVNAQKPAKAHAEIASICLSEAVYAIGPRRTELLDSARSHIGSLRLLLTAKCPEEAWITYNELFDLLELFDNPDRVLPATSL